MRLKPEKIEILAKKAVESISKMQKVKLLVPEEQIVGTIRRVITSDLQREDQLEKEAEAILRQHRLAIDRQNMSYSALLARTKQELAKKNKIIL